MKPSAFFFCQNNIALDSRGSNLKQQKNLIPPTYTVTFQAHKMVWCLGGSPYASFKHLLLNSYLCIQIQDQTGVWDTHGAIFIFKTSPSQTYIQLQAQKGLIRVGPRMQMNELLVLLSEAELLNHSYPKVTF